MISRPRNPLPNTLITALLLIIVVSVYGCKNQPQKEQVFASNFSSTEARTWIGPEYWSNPLQDWQIVNGTLECLVSNKNRNVHLLTKKLDTIVGDLKMRVNLQLFNLDSAEQDHNWVGFGIGSSGNFNDYRDDAVFGKGLNVGLTTNGHLFIEEYAGNKVNTNIRNFLQKEVRLEVVLSPMDKGYRVTLSLFENGATTPLAQITKEISVQTGW